MQVVIITFESALSDDEVESLYEERSDHYREMDGLVQKYYLYDDETGRAGGVYVFDSEASRDALLASDIHAAIRDAYEARDVEVETYPVMFPLYESVETPPSS